MLLQQNYVFLVYVFMFSDLTSFAYINLFDIGTYLYPVMYSDLFP